MQPEGLNLLINNHFNSYH